MYEEQGVDLQRILTDRGTEYCGKIENHPYQLYLDLEDIEHTRTKVKHPQTNGICERLHRTIQDEFILLSLGKKFLARSRKYNWNWMNGFNGTIQSERIQANTVLGKHHGKRSWIQNILRMKNRSKMYLGGQEKHLLLTIPS
jgi:transposase InsO family protein